MLSIIKLQNLKAIHNKPLTPIIAFVVINHKITKFESNSQQAFLKGFLLEVVINRKTIKFESNSQPTNE
ncbi:hypothetical protein HMPREF9074_07968 [Capnocytophaga sp. oral taxon 329 str. F0087]|nr:hypothetical protein HMPREF9074_07968 [Capnocytophaga sp. oral taxon 329 str. F0087]